MDAAQPLLEDDDAGRELALLRAELAECKQACAVQAHVADRLRDELSRAFTALSGERSALELRACAATLRRLAADKWVEDAAEEISRTVSAWHAEGVSAPTVEDFPASRILEVLRKHRERLLQEA